MSGVIYQFMIENIHNMQAFSRHINDALSARHRLATQKIKIKLYWKLGFFCTFVEIVERLFEKSHTPDGRTTNLNITEIFVICTNYWNKKLRTRSLKKKINLSVLTMRRTAAIAGTVKLLLSMLFVLYFKGTSSRMICLLQFKRCVRCKSVTNIAPCLRLSMRMPQMHCGDCLALSNEEVSFRLQNFSHFVLTRFVEKQNVYEYVSMRRLI